jgi:hypothetical protein
MLTVLWSGVDTLEASFGGDLGSELVENLAEAKSRAQERDCPEPFLVGDVEFGVSPTGMKPWPYLLLHEDLHLRLSPAPTIPTVSARLSASGLMTYGQDNLYRLAEKLAAELGAKPSGLSRLDLAVDFQGHVPTVEEMGQVVCHSPFRPVYPSLEHPQTFQFGRGDFVVRLYNKSEELKKSGKGWLKTVWAQHPDFDPAKDVWRFEAQFRRPKLVALGCGTTEEALSRLDRLLMVALTWCSPREEVESNLSRCPVQEWWDELGKAACAGAALPAVKEERRAWSFRKLVPQAMGLLVSGAAYAGVKNFEQAIDLQKQEMRAYIVRSGIPFDQRVEERRRKVNR